jgi:hypothetical protein
MPLPRPTENDKFDAETLPDPELNPLLNPLLGAHMGRWAEVYFTSPPEKRSQAVSELLRELENEPPSENAPIPVVNPLADDERRQRKLEAIQLSQGSSGVEEHGGTCSACAHENRVGQKFCGMCGAPLQVSQQINVPHYAETTADTASGAEDSWINSVEHESTVLFPSPDGSPDALPTWSGSETEVPHFAVEPESLPYRYRLYVGAVLAILLATLLYMAWRGTAAFSGPRSAASKPIPAEPSPAPAATVQSPKRAENVLPAEGSPASPARIQPQLEPASRNDRIATARPASPVVTMASSSSAVATEQSGAEEFAMAQKYLNHNAGASADSSGAVQWLWKSVAKGNLAATMALSDLYLRGEGVPKSCDQARLLLDAAARKGRNGAAERLRNLQAFGCE